MSGSAPNTPTCYLRVVNWARFQHYSDRAAPPWIKFYANVLEDPAIALLADCYKAHLFGLWLLASRLGNRLPNNAKFLSNRVNATELVDLELLIRGRFLEHHPDCGCGRSEVSPAPLASDPLAKCSLEESERRGEEKRNGHVGTEPDGPVRDQAQPTAPPSDHVLSVFDHWRAVMGHPASKLTPKRRRLVIQRLRDGYTVDQLRSAIDGCRLDPHNMGHNDRNTVYDDLELICRDGEHVERFMRKALGQSGPRPVPTPPRTSQQPPIDNSPTALLQRAAARRGYHLDLNGKLTPTGDTGGTAVRGATDPPGGRDESEARRRDGGDVQRLLELPDRSS
jgi:hypothetical protein